MAGSEAPEPAIERGPTLWTSFWPYAFLGFSLLVTYAHLAFSNLIGVDEPWLGVMSFGESFRFWIGVGRWGMAVTNALLPAVVAPAVGTISAIALSSYALWRATHRIFALSLPARAVLVSIAMTMTPLTFQLSWMTNAPGIGVALLATVLAVERILDSGWRSFLAATALGAYACGTYESLVLSLAALSCAALMVRPSWARVWRGLGMVAGAASLALVVGVLARTVLGVPRDPYVTSLIAPALLASDPAGAIRSALSHLASVLLQPDGSYGVSSPWQAVVLACLGSAALWSTWRDPVASRLKRGCFVVLALLPVVACLLVPDLPERAMHFLPITLVCLGGLARSPLHSLIESTGQFLRRARWISIGVALLAITGNATIANVQYSAADTVARHDDYMTQRIWEELRLVGHADDSQPLAVVMSTCERSFNTSWRGRGEFNRGLYTWETWRPATALRFAGINVVAPTPSQMSRGETILATMPTYPRPGWVRVSDGLLLVACAPQNVDSRVP